MSSMNIVSRAKIGSLHPEPVTVSTTVDTPVLEFLQITPKMRECMALLPDVDPDNLFPDDVDWDVPCFSEVLRSFEELINFDYRVRPAEGKVNELAQTMATPIKAALNCYVPQLPKPADILVIGADKGQDVNRIKEANGDHFGNLRIDVVEPNEDVQMQLANTMRPLGSCGRQFRGTLSEARDKGFLRQYDLVVHGLGPHVCCSTDQARYDYASTIAHVLKDRGKMIATYIDVGAAKRLDLVSNSQLHKAVTVLDYDETKFVEGCARLRIGDKVFVDPVLTPKGVYDMFHPHDVMCRSVPAKFLFRDPPKNLLIPEPVPRFRYDKWIDKWIKNPALTLVTYLEVHKVDGGVPAEMGGWGDCGEKCLPWSPRGAPPEDVATLLNFPTNHGRPLTRAELVYLTPDRIAVAPKLDGITGRMLIKKGVAWLADERGVHVAERLAYMQDFVMLVQTENMYVAGQLTQVVATDVYMIGHRTPSTFIERWLTFSNIFMRNEALTPLCDLQEYKHSLTPAALRRILSGDCPGDGWVLQPWDGFPGRYKSKYDHAWYGSARYLKKVVTIDIVREGIVWEVPFATRDVWPNSVARVRPDKAFGNTPLQCHYLEHAVSIEEYCEFTHVCDRVDLTPSHIPTFLRWIAGTAEASDIPTAELMLAVVGRYRDHEVRRFLRDVSPIVERKYVEERVRAVDILRTRSREIAQEAGVVWKEERMDAAKWVEFCMSQVAPAPALHVGAGDDGIFA